MLSVGEMKFHDVMNAGVLSGDLQIEFDSNRRILFMYEE